MRKLAFVIALVATNALFVLQITGVAYEPFSWQAFAQVYENPGEPPTGDAIDDPDGDAIKSPGRDPDTQTFNPSGCFFDLATGAIASGGMVTASCTGCGGTEANVPKGADPMDGSNGCFAFKYTTGPNAGNDPTGGIGAVFDFTITPPAQCVLAPSCPDQGAFATSGSGVSAPGPISIGNFPDAALTMLPAACTPWYSQVTFDTEDGSHVVSAVINNNIALDCCGNGIVSDNEVCDDGNTVDGDGCNADCTVIETGFECPMPGEPCEAICGDGLVVGDETCDDRNTDAADCCMNCQIQEDCEIAPAPVLGPLALGAVVLCLLALGLFASRSRRTQGRSTR